MLSLEPIEVVISEAEPGPPGPTGPPGPASAFFEFAQPIPLADWIVNHNLGFRPNVAVFDDGGNVVLAAVAHLSVNQCRINFAVPMTGRARCS
jgi:hypothetical protein